MILSIIYKVCSSDSVHIHKVEVSGNRILLKSLWIGTEFSDLHTAKWEQLWLLQASYGFLVLVAYVRPCVWVYKPT